MKYLKQIFESTQNDVKLKKTLDDYSWLITLTKEYLTNDCVLENNTEIVSIDDMWWFTEPKHYQNKKAFPEMPIFQITYTTIDDDINTHILYKKDYEDFLLYLDDPELYRNKKKYNL